MKTIKYPAKITKNYILKLSIPIFFSNLAIPLVGVIDTGLMGNLGSEKFLAATSIATSVITMIFWSFGFLRMGTTGLIAQALGKGDYREIVLTTLRNIAIATIIALILILLKDKILTLKEQIEENKKKAEEKEEEEESKEGETDDVFASFKSYNQSSNDKVQKDKTELTRNDVVCDKANKYLHRGKLKEANFGKKNEKVSKWGADFIIEHPLDINEILNNH